MRTHACSCALQVLFVVRIGLAASVIDDQLDGEPVAPGLLSLPSMERVVEASMLASTIGIAAGMSGVLHGIRWNTISKEVANGVGFIALVLSTLAMGYSCK